MFLKLEPNSSEPLYQQVVRQVRQRIAGGSLKPGEQLESARDLSAQLKINFLTVTKAYQILEQEGFVEMRRGLGTFVSARSSNAVASTKQKLLNEMVESLAEGASQMGFQSEEVIRLLEKKMKNKENL